MNKLIFIAGEPGSGKTECIAKPLSEHYGGLVIHTDSISKRAAFHHQPERKLGCRWQLWKLEFDDDENHDALRHALLRSMKERTGKPVDQSHTLIVEGALAGHPAFRRLLTSALSELGFTAARIATFAICPPWDQIQQNLKKRGRPEDQKSDFIEARSTDYCQRLADQADVKRFTNPCECIQAVLTFLQPSEQRE